MNNLSGQPGAFVKLRASFLGIATSATLVLTAGTSFAESKGSYSIFPLGQRTGVVKLKEEYVPYVECLLPLLIQDMCVLEH